jgi:transglutaminase-like putative cysteine protease
MSHLRIQHNTTYRYARPVNFGRHRLVLHPREGHDLRVVSLKLVISPTHHLTWTRDVFGNSVAILDGFEAASTLEIFSDLTVQRSTPFPSQEPHQPWRIGYPFSYEPMEQSVAAAYQIISYPGDHAGVHAWLEQTMPDRHRKDAEEMLLALCMTIKDQVTYLRRTEKGVQSPLESLERKSGSCRDMATLMMEAARGLGIASRFVSGYLHCAASVAGRASTHAWMEAYLPGLGWRGFDPTLGEQTSLKHVPIGVSHHPRGVMPITGTFDGMRQDFLELIVEVKTEDTGGT